MAYKVNIHRRILESIRRPHKYRVSFPLGRKFMVYCDLNENILEWGSEEIVMPYRSPVDGRVHRYFPDFYIKVKESTGRIKVIRNQT